MGNPWWKQAFDAVEQQVGPVVDEVMANPDVVEVLAILGAVQKRAAQDVAALAKKGLHSLNMPAGTDIQKVSHQIAALERELRQLNRRLDELTEYEDGDDE